MAESEQPWVIWSFEHNAWWGPDRCGYVSDLADAGRYSHAEVDEIVGAANRFGKGVINEQGLPLPYAERYEASVRQH